MTEPSGTPEDFGVPPPQVPSISSAVAPVERVHELLGGLDVLAADIERVRVLRDELRALRVLTKHLGRWRSYYCVRMWLANVPTHIIAKAAGVADTYVSRGAKKYGLPPRRNDKRRGDTPPQGTPSEPRDGNAEPLTGSPESHGRAR